VIAGGAIGGYIGYKILGLRGSFFLIAIICGVWIGWFINEDIGKFFGKK